MIQKRLLGVAALAALGSSACMYPHAMADPIAAPSCGPQAGREQAISWIHPAREGDVRRLSEWCASVGPPAYASAPDGSIDESGLEVDFAGDVASPDVSVVTWNVQGRAGNIESFLLDELAYDCSTQRGREHFVLLVQEGVRRSPSVPEAADAYAPALGSPETNQRPDLVAAARTCGLSFLYVPSMRNGVEGFADGREDRGNAILSSLPLLEPTAIELPFEGQRRVAVMASVEGPASRDTISFVSLHLDSFAGIARALLTGASSKERQVLGLVDALGLGAGEAGARPGGARTTLVAGDLNTWSERQTAVQRLVEYFPESPPVDAQPTRGAFPTDHVFALVPLERETAGDSDELELPTRRLTVDGSTYELIPSTYLSDHRPRRLRLTTAR